jgi:Uma2 family endonuclease
MAYPAMIGTLEQDRRCALEEYFEIETASEVRHEYVDGQMVEMASGTGGHSHVAANIGGSMWSRLRGKPCQGRGSNLRVRYGRRGEYGYPDALIVCGPPLFDPLAPPETALLNPRVLIEVLSDSTEAYDRGRKFARYREIESFIEYLLIDSDRPWVDAYRRQPSGLCMLQSYNGLEATVPIESVGIELPLVEVYANVVFPPDKDDTAAVQIENS